MVALNWAERSLLYTKNGSSGDDYGKYVKFLVRRSKSGGVVNLFWAIPANRIRLRPYPTPPTAHPAPAQPTRHPFPALW
mgnify:FL=1